MNNDLISVIVPVYNVEQYLGECIESVLRQTHRNIELIIINDGSTDNTLSVINRYKAIDNRIVTVNIEHQGPSAARNAGLDIAKGSYISFLDSDDIFLTDDYLKLLYEKIIEYDADQSLCFMTKIKDDILPEVVQINVKDAFISGRDILLNRLPYFYVGNLLTYLFKKKDFENIRFPEGIIMEDNAIIHRLLYKSKRVAIVDKAMYAYRLRKSSLMRSIIPHEFYIGACHVYKDRIQFYTENNDQELLDQAIYDRKDYLSKRFVEAMKIGTVDLIPKELRLSPGELVDAYIVRGFHAE